MALINIADAIYFGDRPVDRVYAGAQRVWPSWLPVDLFANGEQGGAWDFTRPDKLFQDAGGTLPVSQEGDPIGLALDMSPNENHLFQTTTTARPAWGETFAGIDGVDDMLTAGPISGPLQAGWYLAASIDRRDTAITAADFRIRANSGPNDYLDFFLQTSERVQTRFRGLSVGVDQAAALSDTGSVPLNTFTSIEGWITQSQVVLVIAGKQYSAAHTLGDSVLGTSLTAFLPVGASSGARRYRRVLALSRTPQAGERDAILEWLSGGA